MPRTVVITGLGAVTGHGVGAPALWDALIEGRSCLGPVTRFDASGFRSRLAGEVKDFTARDYVPRSYRKAVKLMARDSDLAVAAAQTAVDDAGLITRASGDEQETTYPGSRLGCHIGAGLIAAEADELAAAMSTARADGDLLDLREWGESGMHNLTPLWLLKYLPNMLACHVTIIHGAEGPSNTITCAEASGILSIGESARIIQRGDADVGFAGGAESKLNLMGLLRQDIAGRLAHTDDGDDQGWRYVRPYDEEADGTILAEGGGILILEDAEQAAARGAKPYARVAGFGAAQSSIWYEDGQQDEGYVCAIEAALADARVAPEKVDAVVPLASGIPALDRAEAGAIRAVFGDRSAELPLVTLCPFIGNTFAGAGGVQAAVAAMCLRHQRLPARLHAGTPPRWLDAAGREPASARLEYVLVTTGALGGQNAALLLQAIS